MACARMTWLARRQGSSLICAPDSPALDAAIVCQRSTRKSLPSRFWVGGRGASHATAQQSQPVAAERGLAAPMARISVSIEMHAHPN